MDCQMKGSIIKQNAIFVKLNFRIISSEKNNSEKNVYYYQRKRINTLQEDIMQNSVISDFTD